MEFREHRLDNGLTIIAECNPRAYSTAVGFFVNTGSRDESDEIAGVSHFLEHMAFKGTPKRTAADVNRELDEMGSHCNAQTGEERTIYYATVLPEFQDQVLELLSDIMRPALREDDFESEKKVIIEEICMYEDQPPFNANEKCMASFFGRHPLGRSILGTAESVGSLTPKQMQAYFQQRYSPRNITLVAAGKVDFDRFVAKADQHCGSWEPFDAQRETPLVEPQTKFETIYKEDATQQYSVQIAKGPTASDDDRFAGGLLSMILGDDSGSRFYWDLVESGLAEYAVMATYGFESAGIFMTFHCCAPEQAADNLRRIHDLQVQVERDGVTQAELDRAISKINSHFILQSERPGNRLFAVGLSWLHRREYRTVREVAARYQSLTVDDVAAVLEKYPISSNTTLAIGPLEKLAPIS